MVTGNWANLPNSRIKTLENTLGLKTLCLLDKKWECCVIVMKFYRKKG